MKSFRFSIDRGGTFTDVYAESSDGDVEVIKLLSVDPLNYDDAPREGIRRILAKYLNQNISLNQVPVDSIESIRMGTTVATNALLERKGEPCVLVVTEGFRDVLKIAYQNRPDLFDLKIEKPDQVYVEVLEADERVRLVKADDIEYANAITGASGEKLKVLKPLNTEKIKQQLKSAYLNGIRSVAVVLMHAYTFHEHEKIIGNLAAEIGYSQISLSHQVMPMVKLVARGDTTTVDAYLTPHIFQYLKGFKSGFKNRLDSTALLFMQSDGGLVNADRFKGSNAVLSGPAGGVVGFAETTWKEFQQPVIGFDMGGTSTDVSRFGGAYERVFETETAGVRIQSPQMAIKTVAAGGGSRLFFRNSMLQVGPESSGAHPGPVCYKKDGYLSITDANLLLGRIQAEFFPKIFGKEENEALDIGATRRAFNLLLEQVNFDNRNSGIPAMTMEELAFGFIRIANETMVRPIREISVMKGYDIKNHILSCFGGAGGQHACSIARQLGIRTVYIHKYAGILSAYGMNLAKVVSEKQEAASTLLDDSSKSEISSRLDRLQLQTEKELMDQGFNLENIESERYLNLRFEGTDTSMMIQEIDQVEVESIFRNAYLREFGFELTERKIQIDDVRVRSIAGGNEALSKSPFCKPTEFSSKAKVQCYFDGGWQVTDVYSLEDLPSGTRLSGPLFIVQGTSTIIVEPDCEAEVNQGGDLIIHLHEISRKKISEDQDPVQLSIFSHLFMSVAEQMGRTLQRTSVSTNIKERLDFSCAIFDEYGNLVANAPHVPVHLGAMGNAVKFQIKYLKGKLNPGDVLVTNHPAAGGSHLPDITVITPIWAENEIVFFVASRGHHAEIGGINPGSMPPFSKTLADEGIQIKSFKIVEKGVFQEDRLTKMFQSPVSETSPGSRKVEDNLSDLKAQIAANNQGEKLLIELIDQNSLSMVKNYMSYMQKNAARSVREMLLKLAGRFRDGSEVVLEAEDRMDDGTKIHLKINIDRADGTAVFDFSGSDDQKENNLNAPEAITYSALIYALRCMIKEEIPLNQGCLEPVTVILREGSILKPSDGAAVVGGNVLTSQRITDVIFKAFGAAAASQGCMNNLTFGNEDFGYYETICGGAGAGVDWHGQSGVHTHMTNTRITDPEILERRYPVLLKAFSLREGSGGKGEFNGGDGVVREIEFLDQLDVSILSERRIYPPYGLHGGAEGKKGENLFITRNNKAHKLGGKNSVRVEKGDRIRIATPGGGGYGSTK